MPIQAAQLNVAVNADTGEAENKLRGMGGVVDKASGAFKFLAGAAVIGATAVIAGGVAAVKMAGDFQSGMTTLVTGAGEAESNMKMVGDGILALAVSTGTSTQQLTAGMFMIESAGFHGAAALDVLKSAAQGAKVGNADLGAVADAVTTEMVDYGKSGLTAAQATNILIATVANGKTHMQDLAASMASILPTAAAVGVSLYDVQGAMATMTGEGVPAANAATYLRQTLMALDAPSHQTIKALESVGLTSKEVSDKLKTSLPDALQMITDAVGKKFPVGSAAYVDALKKIAGGSKQMQGILDLTGDHLATLKGNVATITDATKKAGSGIEGWALVQQDFNFKIDQGKAAIETMGIKIGTALLPVLGKLMGAIAPLVTAFSSNLTPIMETLSAMFTKTVVPAIAQVAAWFNREMLPSLMTLAKFVQAHVVPVFQQLAGFILAHVVPAAEKLAAWFMQKVVPILEKLWIIIQNNVMPALESIAATVMEKLMPALENLWNKISPILIPAFQAVGDILQNVVGPALNLAIGIISGLIDIISNAIGKIGDFFNLLGGIKDKVGGAIGAVGNALGAVGNFLGGHASGGYIPQSGIALVGEQGPELVALPGGSTVYPNGTLPPGMGGGKQGHTYIVNVTNQAPSVQEIMQHFRAMGLLYG